MSDLVLFLDFDGALKNSSQKPRAVGYRPGSRLMIILALPLRPMPVTTALLVAIRTRA